jgi:HEAT repeat protein
LARLNPTAAKPLLAVAVAHSTWQVRAAAAAATAGLADEAHALTLAHDVHPNVQTAALDALSRMRSPAVVAEALDVLKTATDYQLIRTAGGRVEGAAGLKNGGGHDDPH